MRKDVLRCSVSVATQSTHRSPKKSTRTETHTHTHKTEMETTEPNAHTTGVCRAQWRENDRKTGVSGGTVFPTTRSHLFDGVQLLSAQQFVHCLQCAAFGCSQGQISPESVYLQNTLNPLGSFLVRQWTPLCSAACASSPSASPVSCTQSSLRRLQTLQMTSTTPGCP